MTVLEVVPVGQLLKSLQV